ncbi:MAG TPA: GNAT family N-acetyltransferase, partial [Devosia sp.]|nr:GNAT family N-acetyltransferase [Devosia sp.]
YGGIAPDHFRRSGHETQCPQMAGHGVIEIAALPMGETSEVGDKEAVRVEGEGAHDDAVSALLILLYRHIPAIREMQARSMWTLGADFYTRAEIANFMEAFGTMDNAIVIEGHFFIAEDPGGAILASGAWSRVRPGYAAGMSAREPAADIPTVRSVFVDPAIARRGVGSAIMRCVEYDAASHGVRLLGLTATLSGVPLYERLGYQVQEVTRINFSDKTRFGCVKMRKPLADCLEAG